MIPIRARDSFWGVVRDCLVTFHDVPATRAGRLCGQRRSEVESRPRGVSRDIFYHNEPFDVACDLAGKELDITQFRSEYDRILDENHPQPSRR
jgi:hypothetical protein